MIMIDAEMPRNCCDCCFVGIKREHGKKPIFICDILDNLGKDNGSVEEIFQTTCYGRPDNCPLLEVGGE